MDCSRYQPDGTIGDAADDIARYATHEKGFLDASAADHQGAETLFLREVQDRLAGIAAAFDRG